MSMRQRTLYELGCQLGNRGPCLDQKARGSGNTSETVTRQMKRARGSINVLYCYAKGLGPIQALELKKCLKNKKIHIALIQETKERSKFPPSFPGYEPYKCTNTCQGILILIKTDIQTQVSKVKTNDANDIHHIKIWHTGQKYNL